MKERETKEIPSRFEIRVSIKPPRKVREPEIRESRVKDEPPGGETKDRCSCAYGDESQRIPQCNRPAQQRISHRHHAVPTTRVVSLMTPAKCIKVRELPCKEDACKNACGWR